MCGGLLILELESDGPNQGWIGVSYTQVCPVGIPAVGVKFVKKFGFRPTARSCVEITLGARLSAVEKLSPARNFRMAVKQTT